jgi:hypothetical protein
LLSGRNIGSVAEPVTKNGTAIWPSKAALPVV